MMSKPYSVQSMYAVFMGVSDGLHGWIDVFLVGFLFQPQMKPDDALQVIAHLGIGDSDVASTQRAQNPFVLGDDAVEPGGCCFNLLPVKDRQSVVSGKSVSVRVDLGGRSIIKKKK